ncbi:iron ABC transporter substrate-binding protein [Phaeovulum sp.]|uniref:iron ABC transporter substrate-binding protein n=1 Tax=Phaeovulum sp. TaxID=2934796 RepID=UPI0039E474EC
MAGPVFAQDAVQLVVYNAQHENLTKAWVEGFTAQTGIQVVLRDGGDTEFANQIVAEGAASPADVFLTENSPAMALVDNAGLFAAVAPDTLDMVAPQYRPTDGHWIGVAARSTVFAYDTRKLSDADAPRSIMDLADPAWKGRWAASPTGADFQAIVAAILDLEGEDATRAWLKGMKANFTAYRGNSSVMKAINAGEVEGGIIYHYYYYRDQAKTGENSKNVALHYFGKGDPGAFVSVSGGGVLASSKQPEAAQQLLKWIVGQGGQDILRTGESLEYALVGASNPALVPLDTLDPPQINPSDLNAAKVSALMTEAGLL